MLLQKLQKILCDFILPDLIWQQVGRVGPTNPNTHTLTKGDTQTHKTTQKDRLTNPHTHADTHLANHIKTHRVEICGVFFVDIIQYKRWSQKCDQWIGYG